MYSSMLRNGMDGSIAKVLLDLLWGVWCGVASQLCVHGAWLHVSAWLTLGFGFVFPVWLCVQCLQCRVCQCALSSTCPCYMSVPLPGAACACPIGVSRAALHAKVRPRTVWIVLGEGHGMIT